MAGIYKIWGYKRKTKKLRAKAGLPQLFDIDDLPDPIYDPNYVHVLTDEEQEDLHRRKRVVVASDEFLPTSNFRTTKVCLFADVVSCSWDRDT